MASATSALQSLDAHKRVVDNEHQTMKDDIAFLRDLRRRYTLPLSELPPCRGLPAPVAASARKFLVETEAYIMRRISACQQQAAEISSQAGNLRDQINQTASIAHSIAGTTPTPYANAPGGNYHHHNIAASAVAAANAASVGNGTNNYNNNIQTPGVPPQITFQDPLNMRSPLPNYNGGATMASPGAASRYTAATTMNMNNNAGGGNGGFYQPSPFAQQQQQQQASNQFGGAPEIRFEAPLGVLPYMTAASAAYRQQQALAYLAADQGVLPRTWAPAPMNPQPLVPFGMAGGGGGGGGARGGGNVSPSRRYAMEMSGGTGADGTTFVVLPRSSSTEPRAAKRFR